MKKFFLLSALIVLVSSPVYSADDSLDRAISLYKKHFYERAARILRDNHTAPRHAKALMSMGLIHLKNGELYHELHETSRGPALDYLNRLAAVSGKAQSRFVDLYLGETHLSAGNMEQAAVVLNRFIAHKDIPDKYRAIARIGLGHALFRKGDVKKAEALWKTAQKQTDPEVQTALAAVYMKLGLADKNPTALFETALAASGKNGAPRPMRVISDGIGIYARTGKVEKGFGLLDSSDIKKYAQEEVIDQNKVLRFYSPDLLKNLSLLHVKASIATLSQVPADAKLKDTADYYLIRAYALLGDNAQSHRIIDPILTSPDVPFRLKDKVKVVQAEIDFFEGRTAEAFDTLDTLSAKTDPGLLAEILLTVGKFKSPCNNIVTKAEVTTESRGGKKMSKVNYALGKYYLEKKDFEKAIGYMEAGRDKSNKSRLEYNDPLMLIDLALAYCHTRQFSEALEIYFSMSKEYPAVRQIQEAVQGIYSMEQKSAGDVKIF